jgi:hypothetical protein
VSKKGLDQSKVNFIKEQAFRFYFEDEKTTWPKCINAMNRFLNNFNKSILNVNEELARKLNQAQSSPDVSLPLLLNQMPASNQVDGSTTIQNVASYLNPIKNKNNVYENK